MNLHTEREFAVRLLREASVLLRPFMASMDKRRDSSRHKGVGEVVTEADQQVNDYILNRISEVFPADSVCAEEGSDRDDPSADRRWILDPIDGTRSFVEGRPGYSLMMALAVAGEPVVAVVHDPVSDVTWYAVKDEGIWRLDSSGLDRVMPPETPDPRLIWSPYAEADDGTKLAAELGLGAVITCESFGLRAIDVAKHGGGAFASRPSSPHQWDTAPAWLFMHEIGGTVTGYDGAPLKYQDGPNMHPHGAVASLGLDHARVRELMHKYLSA